MTIKVAQVPAWVAWRGKDCGGGAVMFAHCQLTSVIGPDAEVLNAPRSHTRSQSSRQFTTLVC